MAGLTLNWANASEATLIVAVKARDQGAFAELVKRRQAWTRGLLRRLCGGNQAEADDLAQEAFMRAWDRMTDLKTPAAFPGWFRRIAVTCFLMSRRRTRTGHDNLDDAPALTSEDSPPDVQAGARIDLEKALASLSDAERLCVTLNHGEGMSHGEIAAATGMPLGTVKSHVLRATNKVRGLLNPEQGR